MKPRRLRLQGLPEQLMSRRLAQFAPIQSPFKVLVDEKIMGKTARHFSQLINLNSLKAQKLTLNQAEQMRGLAAIIERDLKEREFFGGTQHNILIEIGTLRGTGIMLNYRYRFPFESQIGRQVESTFALLGAINNRIQKAAEDRKAH